MSNQNSGNNEFDPTRGGNDPAAGTVLAEQGDGKTAPLPSSPRQPGFAPKRGRPSTGTATPKGELGLAKLPVMRDAALGGLGLSPEAMLVKKALEKESRHNFFIPLDPGEKRGAFRPVTINGYRCEVRKGVMASLPYSIFMQLLQAYDVEVEVQYDNPLNLENQGDDVVNALTR